VLSLLHVHENIQEAEAEAEEEGEEGEEEETHQDGRQWLQLFVQRQYSQDLLQHQDHEMLQ